jgi:hypothetical protein
MDSIIPLAWPQLYPAIFLCLIMSQLKADNIG